MGSKGRFDISLEDAVFIVTAFQDASKQDDYDLTILNVGHDQPLVFATHCIAEVPYDSRAEKGRIPEEAFASAERFTAETWTTHPLHELPWPFEDNQFDVVWCVNVLETMPNAAEVMKEIFRVTKCGYIQVTHRNYGSVLNVESPDYVGFSKHHWLFEPVANEDMDGLLLIPRIPTPHPDLIPMYTGDYEIGVWWTGSMDVREIAQEDTEDNLLSYANYTKELKYASR